MSFTDKKTLSVAEAVKNVLSKKPDPNDINDPRNFNAKDPKMLNRVNTNLKNSEATKAAYAVAHSFGKSPEKSSEKPKPIPYMPDNKSDNKKSNNSNVSFHDKLVSQSTNPSVMVTNRFLPAQMALSKRLGDAMEKYPLGMGKGKEKSSEKSPEKSTSDSSGTVNKKPEPYGVERHSNRSISVDMPKNISTGASGFPTKEEDKPIKISTGAEGFPTKKSKPTEKPVPNPNQDKVDAANRVQSGQRATVMSSPSAQDSENLQSAKKDVISSAMRKQQDMERHKELAKNDDNNTSTDKDVPDDDINKATKQSKKTNEDIQMTTFRDAVIKALYETKKKADKDHDQDGKIESPKDEVWGSRLRAAKMAGKLKEEQIDEAFPTVADGEKSLKAKEGKTSKGTLIKTKTGVRHERDYDDTPEPEEKRGRGRPAGSKSGAKKRLSEMRQKYFNYFEEEVDNETFTKELKDQKAKFDGKKKGADVAKASVQAVKQEEVEHLDELVKIFHRTKPGAKEIRYDRDSPAPEAAAHRKSTADAARAARNAPSDSDRYDFKTGITMKTNKGGTVFAHKEEVEHLDEKKGSGESDPLQNRADYAASNRQGQVYKKTYAGDKKGMTKAYAYDIKRTGPKGKLPEEVEQIDEVAPPGREDQVKALKKVPGIDNPWAVSWASYRKSHPKKSKD